MASSILMHLQLSSVSDGPEPPPSHVLVTGSHFVFGHVVDISSIGVQTGPPRFSAYVASKAALDAWARIVATEVIGDGVTFTTVHMPLVRTEMIAPTRIYDAFPTLSPEEAGRRIADGRKLVEDIVGRPALPTLLLAVASSLLRIRILTLVSTAAY